MKTKVTTDIDIDLANRDYAVSLIECVPALQSDGNKHKTSVYFQNIPRHPKTGFASIDTKQAAELGYFKIDLLNNNIYKLVRDEKHLVELSTTEPPWELFEKRSIVEKLYHIHKYFKVVNSIKPKSIEDLAIIIALIRPGKKHLIGKPRPTIDLEIWTPVDGEGYAFKKAHAFSYALSIIVQLNLLIDENITDMQS